MRRYLLVLDRDLLAADEELGLQPISYLLTRQQQQPCEVVVLSLVDTRQARVPALELLLGTSSNIAKFPVAPRPGHDISAAAEHRMNLAVRHLRMIGCQASGFISDQDLVTAVRSETRSYDYDEVILVAGTQPSTWLARVLHRDPVHRLRSRWGPRLVAFPSARAGRVLCPRSSPVRPDSNLFRVCARAGTCSRRAGQPPCWRKGDPPAARCSAVPGAHPVAVRPGGTC